MLILRLQIAILAAAILCTCAPADRAVLPMEEDSISTPSIRSAYLPGTPELEILRDLHRHLASVAARDPDLMVLAVVFFQEPVAFVEFERVFHQYGFDASSEDDAINLVFGGAMLAAPLTSEITSSATAEAAVSRITPWRTAGPAEIDVEGFIAVVRATSALRLWDSDVLPVRGIGIMGTADLGATTFWNIPRPKDPLR